MRIFTILEFSGIDFPFFIQKGIHTTSFSPHSHDFIELEIIIGGSASHVVDGQSYPLKSGDVVIIMPSHIHELQKVQNLEHYSIKFDLDKLILLESDIEKLSGFQSLFILQPLSRYYHEYTNHIILNDTQLAYTKSLCELIYTEWINRLDGYQWVIKSYLLALITFLSRSFSPYIAPDSHRMSDIAKSVTFIHENISRKITVSMLSEMACISERQYSRIFKSVYNISPIEYVIKCRLTLACSMLKHSHNTIADISYNCGFSDKVSFSRLFKKYYKKTPSAYRSQQSLDFC